MRASERMARARRLRYRIEDMARLHKVAHEIAAHPALLALSNALLSGDVRQRFKLSRTNATLVLQQARAIVKGAVL